MNVECQYSLNLKVLQLTLKVSERHNTFEVFTSTLYRVASTLLGVDRYAEKCSAVNSESVEVNPSMGTGNYSAHRIIRSWYTGR